MSAEVKPPSEDSAAIVEADGAVELTQRQLARVLGVSAASIVAWEGEGLPCLGDRGRHRLYDAGAAVQWWLAREVARRGADDPDRKRLLRAQADRQELELARRAGRLVDADDVRRSQQETARMVADAMLALPARVAAIVAPADPPAAQRLLEHEVRRALTALAAALEQP
ncbi:MAG: terminase small subunit [Burkholderiales bacterium]|nr:terminase small subunit [Burkholderiales bacterium]